MKQNEFVKTWLLKRSENPETPRPLTKLTPNLEVFWSDMPEYHKQECHKLSNRRKEMEGAKRWEFEGDRAR